MAENEYPGDHEYNNPELDQTFNRLNETLGLVQNHASDLALLDGEIPDGVGDLYEVKVEAIDEIDLTAPDSQLDALFRSDKSKYEARLRAIMSGYGEKIPVEVLTIERLRVHAVEIVAECATLMVEAREDIAYIDSVAPEGNRGGYERQLGVVRKQIVEEFSALFGANEELVSLVEGLLDGEIEADQFRDDVRDSLPYIKWNWG